MDVVESSANFQRFTSIQLWFSSLIGVSVRSKQSFADKIRIYLTLCMNLFVLAQSVAFVFVKEGDEENIFSAIRLSSYCIAYLGKLMYLVHKRSLYVKIHEGFQRTHPTEYLEQKYNLDRHLHSFQLIVKINLGMFVGTAFSFLFHPIFLSLYGLWHDGQHGQQTPLQLWYPLQLKSSFVVYLLAYVMEVIMYCSGCAVIYAFDFSLFSALNQLCLRFDLLAQQILEIDPRSETGMEDLVKLAKRHQVTVKLVDHVNEIFTPIVILNLLSHSMIICLSLFQLLDEVTLVKVLREGFVVGFELQSLAFICYHGNKLVQFSSKFNGMLYAHNWLDGGLQYRRQVLFMMMNTLRPKSLRIGGVAEISLIVFKEVLTITYQIFTVSKTALVRKAQASI